MTPPAAALSEPRLRVRATSAPTRPALRAGEIDVWHASLDEQMPDVVEAMQSLISPDEAGRARRFYFERDRRRFIVGRGILRTLLGHYAGLPAKSIAFRYGANGKPMLALEGAPPVFFNAAHSEGLVVLAFTRTGEVGVDVERIRDIPEWEAIAASYFTPRELGRIQACAPDERRAEFFRAWTRQEALLKAHGIGLGGAVGRGVHAGRRVLLDAAPVAAQPEANSPFQLHPLEMEPGFAGALAVPPAAHSMTSLAWRVAAVSELAALPRRGRRLRLSKFSETGHVSL